MTRIIAVVNQKGGVGKTTSAINIGAGLRRKGRRVLLADLDPQGSLSVSVGVEAHLAECTVYEVLKGKCAARNAIVKMPDYDVLPADIRLSGAEFELGSVPGRELLLKEALGLISGNYDYILIDCPPSLGFTTLNGLTAANEVFIPLQAEFLAMYGMTQLIDVMNSVRKRLNPTLEITGIIVTLYDQRKTLNKDVWSKILLHFPDKVFATRIRANVALAEAPSHGENIYRYKADTNGAQDYLSLCAEIIAQEGTR